MNAVEIEEAISKLAEQPFDPATFPYAFLEAFGNKSTTLKKLQSGASNKSDVEGGVLQYNNIHIAVCPQGAVSQTLDKLKNSPATTRQKAKYILATDGQDFQAEELTNGETVACNYADFPDHFGFFLALAGISTVKQIRENAFDIKATGRLNRLYVELLKDNPDWATADRRPDMNHFMARLIFCFFAEDTDIFNGTGLFTDTIEQMSEANSSNTHEVISELFRAMNTKIEDRATANLPRWANIFPYVNGNLFSGSTETPRFSRIARAYLLRVGKLDWKSINPDIFGSMIQAVADDEERGALGMHYTSRPNILNVLNPLFLDDLRAQLEEAGDNGRSLLNLRKRMSKIRVFDPACGSGNFLVIAYKEMREIEAEINRRRGEPDRRTDIPLTNFRGIELRDFPAEVARLALIIAEYQCDVLYRGQKEALAEFLPLDAQNWITCGNALRLDWLSLCPASGMAVKLHAEDLFHTPLDQAQINFENEAGETYICGNPPYLGGKGQSKEQKEDLEHVFRGAKKIGELDYVAGWLVKASYICNQVGYESAFVCTKSVNQGAQVHQLWPRIYAENCEIKFANKLFKWSNNAQNNAAVVCSIIGIGRKSNKKKLLIDSDVSQEVSVIGPYLVPGNEIIIDQKLSSISELPTMLTGNSPYDGGNLLLSGEEREQIVSNFPEAKSLFRRILGSEDYLNGKERWALWIDNANYGLASKIPPINLRITRTEEFRKHGGDVARGLVDRPHQFRYTHQANRSLIIIPRVSSERRIYIPFGYLNSNYIVSDSAQAIYDAELWVLAIISSKMHMAWVRTIGGYLGTSIRYSSALCYNTFPLPLLTEKNKADLTRCAEDILLAREAHFPETMATLYDPDNMPENLKHAHDRNDEVLERIYIGRLFKNDTERLERLFELYTKMTAKEGVTDKRKKKGV